MEKVSKRKLKEMFSNISYCSYCSLQALLKNHTPKAYNSGIYGWNFDVYIVYGLVICTGYRNLSGKKLQQTEEYESKAISIWNREDLSFEDKSSGVEKLLKEFCALNVEI